MHERTNSRRHSAAEPGEHVQLTFLLEKRRAFHPVRMEWNGREIAP